MPEDVGRKPLLETPDVDELARIGLPRVTADWCLVNGISEMAMVRAGEICLSKGEVHRATLAAFQLGYELHRKQEQKRAARRPGPRYVVKHVVVDIDNDNIVSDPTFRREEAEETSELLNPLDGVDSWDEDRG